MTPMPARAALLCWALLAWPQVTGAGALPSAAQGLTVAQAETPGQAPVQTQVQAPVPASASAPASVTPSTVTRSGNVYVAGGQVRPRAAVQGDLVAVGGRVVVDQPVQGDALLAGGSVDVRAPVGEDLRAGGGDVQIDSSVGGELRVSAGNITLARGASVAQSAALMGGQVTLEGRVAGPLRVQAQRIRIDGAVGGDALLQAEQIELGPQARITGALRYASRATLLRAPGAVVEGSFPRRDLDPDDTDDRDWQDRGWHARNGMPHGHDAMSWGHGWPRGAAWGGAVFGFLALLASAALLLLVFPRFAAQAAGRVRAEPALSVGLGLGTLLVLPVLAVLLFITILGIPLGLALLALLPVVVLVGFVVGVLWLGGLAQAALQRGGRVGDAGGTGGTGFRATLGFFALALLAVMLLGALPFVGGLVLALLTLHRRRQGRPPPPATPG